MKKFKIRVSGLVGLRDMLKTKNLPRLREKMINAAPDQDIVADFPINRNAAALHPDRLDLVIRGILDHPGAGAKTYIFARPEGGPLPYFRAGQYISLRLKFDGTVTTRAYSLCSSPDDAEKGKMAITVKSRPNGFAADRILERFRVGDRVTASAPEGFFYYDPLRDEKQVIAVAGGSGITPFVSMAAAIYDGTEDFHLAILYINRTENSILWKEKLDEISASCEKVRVIYYLTRQELPGYRSGRPDVEDVMEAAGGRPFSVFVCGPETLCDDMMRALKEKNIPKRLIRPENHGVTADIRSSPGYPAEAADQAYRLCVISRGEKHVIAARGDESVLTAIERAGVSAPSRCRSGECGWCRSRLVSGHVFVPTVNDGRRWADRQGGYIHPCASFPLSDITVEIPGDYMAGKTE